ncbi:(2Fe-2S) ferredoxin domain-containing protein [Romeria aff. gracilis LEGE 07310]|uniref:(2Fe-2S) ferredoxin domain-containing protein n=1 Tax=Vasconcelosia minhoensis LEGE 07310 TaxID=915328 RepID=A0A8J7ASI2_9CYAN|nr:(2Fe-2S) ferredoxin domain-containing protein [Romeria aff. gracilis LEGE 07310]
MSQPRQVYVCQNRTCARDGSAQVLKEFCQHELIHTAVRPSGCMGCCGSGPMVAVMPEGTWYSQVRPSDVAAIAEQHLLAGQPVQRLLHARTFAKQA